MMNTDDLATDVQQAPESATLSDEERYQLETEIKQLEARLECERTSIAGLSAGIQGTTKILEIVALMIEEGYACIRRLKEGGTQDLGVLNEFHRLTGEIEDLTSCNDRSEAIATIGHFLAKQTKTRDETQVKLDNLNDSLRAAIKDVANIEAQLAQKRTRLHSAAVNLGDKVAKSIASGLEYMKEEKIIRFKLNGNYITLLSGGKIPMDISRLENFEALDKAWEIFNGEDNATMLSKHDEFIEKLSLKVTRLNKFPMILGWEPLKFDFDFGDDVAPEKGEMFLKQFIYPPYAFLVFAAASAHGRLEKRYKADQKVTGSLSFLTYQSMDDSSPVVTKLSVHPYAAVTLGDKNWDAFGMMELKSRGPDPSSADTLRCVMMTAITALAINKVKNEVMSEDDRKRIAIPFVLGEGLKCSLFVTTLDDQGVPCIKVVKFPGTDTIARDMDVSNLSSIARKQLFVALAVLLDNINTPFEDAARCADYKAKLTNRIKWFNDIPSENFKKKTSDAGNDARNAGQGVRRSSRQAGQSNQQSIQEAQEAASLGGTFTSVECAFERCRFIPSCNMSSNNSKSDDVTTSPFYFKGRMISSKTASTTKDVFLKVWNAEHVGVLPVEMEWTHYKIALNAGVPVAAPVLPEIVLASSSSGLNHLVFAVEYIHEDAIQTIEDIVRFSESLIISVVKLHDAAGLLHCDLKPANVRWSNGVVNLIDFGHAQPINLAVWVY